MGQWSGAAGWVEVGISVLGCGGVPEDVELMVWRYDQDTELGI